MIDLLGLLGAAVIAAAGAWLAGRHQGRCAERRDAINEALSDEQARLQAGRDRLRAGRDDPPDQRLRENDGDW